MINNSVRRMYLHRYYHLQRMGATDEAAEVGATIFVFEDGLRLLSAAIHRAGLSARLASQCFVRLAAVWPPHPEGY